MGAREVFHQATLGVGVIINTFSAVVIPRLVLDYLTRARRIQELSI